MTSNRKPAVSLSCLFFALTDKLEIRVLSTQEALATYNSLVAEGKSVVLIAHTTC